MIAIDVAGNQQSFDCASCTAKHCDEAQEMPGSIGPAAYPRYVINGVIESNTCLLPLINEFSRECLRLYRHYKNGVLLHGGGIYDQPRKYMQAMAVIDGNA